MDTLDKLKFIDGFFKKFGKGVGKVTEAKFLAQTLMAVQTMLQEGQLEKRLEDWTAEEICEFVTSTGFFK